MYSVFKKMLFCDNKAQRLTDRRTDKQGGRPTEVNTLVGVNVTNTTQYNVSSQTIQNENTYVLSSTYFACQYILVPATTFCENTQIYTTVVKLIKTFQSFSSICLSTNFHIILRVDVTQWLTKHIYRPVLYCLDQQTPCL